MSVGDAQTHEAFVVVTFLGYSRAGAADGDSGGAGQRSARQAVVFEEDAGRC